MRSVTWKAHAVFLSTLTPYQGANYWTPDGEAAREQINAFIRGGIAVCDAVMIRIWQPAILNVYSLFASL